jgi:hypothetical protein
LTTVNDRNAVSELLARVSNYDSSPDDNRLEAGERGQALGNLR